MKLLIVLLTVNATAVYALSKPDIKNNFWQFLINNTELRKIIYTKLVKLGFKGKYHDVEEAFKFFYENPNRYGPEVLDAVFASRKGAQWKSLLISLLSYNGEKGPFENNQQIWQACTRTFNS